MPDRDHEKEGVGVVRDGDKHVASTGAGNKFFEAITGNVEMQIKRERIVEVFSVFGEALVGEVARHDEGRFSSRQKTEQCLRRKCSRRVAEA